MRANPAGDLEAPGRARVFDEKRVSSIRGGRTGATLRSKGKWFAVRAIKVAGERLFIAPDLM